MSAKKKGLLNFLRNRLVELAAAMVVVYVITAGVDHREASRREAIPPEDWFEVNDIYVPDHAQGSNPFLSYDRSIYENFTGLWLAEAQRREESGQFVNQCSGSGIDDYDPADSLPEEGVEWQWFFDRPCAVPPGVYRIVVAYDMHRPGYPLKRQNARSNEFEVLPR